MYKIEIYQKLDRKFDVNELKDPLTGNLLFLSGHKWRSVKLSPKFTTGKLKGMFSIIRDCSRVLDDYLSKNVEEEKNEFDSKELFARYIIKVISSVAFDNENDCIDNPEYIFRLCNEQVNRTNFNEDNPSIHCFIAAQSAEVLADEDC